MAQHSVGHMAILKLISMMRRSSKWSRCVAALGVAALGNRDSCQVTTCMFR